MAGSAVHTVLPASAFPRRPPHVKASQTQAQVAAWLRRQTSPQKRFCTAASGPRPCIGAAMKAPIRVALLDDHPAIRAGFEALVAPEADLQVVGFAANEAELWPVLHQTCPDVLVLGVHHPGRGGLELCLQIKRTPQAPAIVLYAASVTDSLLAAAALAGVGAVVCKSDPTIMLLDSIRVLALGMAPSVNIDRIAAMMARLGPIGSFG